MIFIYDWSSLMLAMLFQSEHLDHSQRIPTGTRRACMRLNLQEDETIYMSGEDSVCVCVCVSVCVCVCVCVCVFGWCLACVFV